MDIQTICETLGVTEEKAKELIRKWLHRMVTRRNNDGENQPENYTCG